MHSPDRCFRLPRSSMRGSEATPLTSHASTFWLSPSADSQTRNSLKVSQPCGLKNDLLCSMPLRACSHLENRERVAPAEPTVSGGLRNFTSNPHYPVNRWVMTGQVLTGLPDTLTIPSLIGPGRLGARSLHLSCHAGQARSTGLCINSQKPSLARSTGLLLRLCLSRTSF